MRDILRDFAWFDDALNWPGPFSGPGGTMQVTMDTGPAADQNNIPAVLTTIKDTSITSTVAGHALIIGKCRFILGGANDAILMVVARNGVAIPGSGTSFQVNVATTYVSLVTNVGITDLAVGDVLTLQASSSSAGADISAGWATIILVTA